MINRDFPNLDVKENVKAGWDFPNQELCHVIIQKQYPFDQNNDSSLKTKVTMVNEGRTTHYTLLSKGLACRSMLSVVQLFVK